MNNYSKWDKIEDSGDEEESQRRLATSEYEREAEKQREEQERIEKWIKNQVFALQRTEDPNRPPELKEPAQYRKVNKEDRQVLAMLMVLSHFEEGETNLDRHPNMLELVRHHRWLEEDSGALELLCRVHNQVMRKGNGRDGPGGGGGANMVESPEDTRIRSMCLSAINVLAAANRCGCTGGLLEVMTMICTPTTDAGRENRKKWQKKEFAKDALFDSLFPDLRQYAEEPKDMGWKEVWVFIGVIVLLVVVVLLMMVAPSLATVGTPAESLQSTTTTTLLAATGFTHDQDRSEQAAEL